MPAARGATAAFESVSRDPDSCDGVLRVTHYGENVNHMIPLEDASAFIAQYS